MANYLRSDVESAVWEVERVNGAPFVSSQAANRPAIREALEDLGHAYGLNDLGKVTTKDLLSLYSVACKNIDSGGTVADRIAARSSAFDPFAGIPAAVPSTPPSEPQKPVSGVSADWVRALLATYATTDALDALGNAVSDKLADLQRDIPTQGKLADMISDALKAMTPTSLSITVNNNPPVQTGTVHFMTARIIQILASGLNVYLHGPAGSGKTTAARKIAETFGLPFYFAAKVESEYLLLGFKDARGETIRTQFREAYERGGVFLFDEMDASSPSAIVAINAALANGFCPFPDGVIMQHADFKCIGAGNTKLTGANRQYNGRVQMDAASIDRFYFLEFPYDEALERAIAPNADWCLHVQAVRKAVADRGLSHLVTPRATLAGGIALAAGETWEQAEEGAIFKGLDVDTAEQLRRAASRAIL